MLKPNTWIYISSEQFGVFKGKLIEQNGDLGLNTDTIMQVENPDPWQKAMADFKASGYELQDYIYYFLRDCVLPYIWYEHFNPTFWPLAWFDCRHLPFWVNSSDIRISPNYEDVIRRKNNDDYKSRAFKQRF